MRIRTRSLIIIFSEGVTRSATIVVAIVLVRLVSQPVYGTYRQALLVYGLMASLLSLPFGASLYYFVPKLKPGLRGSLLSQTFLSSVATGVIISSVLFAAASPLAGIFDNPDLAPLLRILSVYPFVDRLLILIPAFMISVDRVGRAGIYSVVGAFGRAVVVVGAFSLGCGLSTVVWSIILVGGIVALLGCLDLARLCRPRSYRLDRSIFFQQLQYVLPLWTTTAVASANSNFDKLLISSFFDPTMYAIYACGALELPIGTLITRSVNRAMMPSLVTLAGKGKPLESLRIWQEGARKCGLVIFPCFVFFLVTNHDFIVLLYGSDYQEARWPFVIYLCMLPIHITTFAALFRALGQTKSIAISSGMSFLVNVTLSTALLVIGHRSFLSFIGPSIGTTFARFVSTSYLTWKLSRILDVPISRVMRWRELGLMLMWSAVTGLCILLIPLPQLSPLIKLSAQAIIFLILLAFILVLTKTLQDDELELLTLPLRAARRLLHNRRSGSQ